MSDKYILKIDIHIDKCQQYVVWRQYICIHGSSQHWSTCRSITAQKDFLTFLGHLYSWPVTVYQRDDHHCLSLCSSGPDFVATVYLLTVHVVPAPHDALYQGLVYDHLYALSADISHLQHTSL